MSKNEPLKLVKTSSDCEFLNVKDAAQFLGVSVDTIYSWTFKRVIPHYKLGKLVKFKRSELIQYMESNRVEPFRVDAQN